LFAKNHLKIALAAAGILVAAPSAGTAQDAGAPAADSGAEVTIFSGVYTEEQAARGRSAYSTACAVCHGPTGQGGPDAPGIIGYVFDQKYDGAPLVSYVDYMRMMMPLGRPGSLSRSSYVDITAFLLASHGAPAGDTELPSDEEALAEIFITKAP
jgi:quinoprotein glucose dehydrogenase